MPDEAHGKEDAMEVFMLCGLLVMVCLGTAVQSLALLEVLRQRRPTAPEQEMQTESEEEREARRAAAEAQRLYEQGFVNLMSYDGRPARKEREQW